MPALGRELHPAQRGVGPRRAASPGRPVEMGERLEGRHSAGLGVDRAHSRSSRRGPPGRASVEPPRRPSRERPSPRTDLDHGRLALATIGHPIKLANRHRRLALGPPRGQSTWRGHGEERVIPRSALEEGLLRDRRFAPRWDVQVEIGEVEDPQDAGEGTGDPPARTGSDGRWSRQRGTVLGRSTADPKSRARPKRSEGCREPLREMSRRGFIRQSKRFSGSTRKACSRLRGSPGASDRC